LINSVRLFSKVRKYCSERHANCSGLRIRAKSRPIVYEQIVLVNTDGTVQPVYTGQSSSPVSSISGTSGVTNTGSQIDTNLNKAVYPQPTTTYAQKDQVSSSLLITGGYGYPVWKSTFLPFGQEYNPQLEVDNLKFAKV
jgi:hypothetical protein